jgi:hypothetical protein
MKRSRRLQDFSGVLQSITHHFSCNGAAFVPGGATDTMARQILGELQLLADGSTSRRIMPMMARPSGLGGVFLA